MLLSRGELAGFGMGLVIIVVMGIIALAGPFHHINKSHPAIGPMLTDKLVNVNSQDAPWQFAPRDFTIKVGQPVTFRNVSTVDHTVTARDNSFNSQNVAPGASWVYTPTTPGKFAYFCQYHPFMTGVITVVK